MNKLEVLNKIISIKDSINHSNGCFQKYQLLSIINLSEEVNDNLAKYDFVDNHIRYQDYYDPSISFDDNAHYFSEFFYADSDLIQFSLYILNKQTSDLIDSISKEIFSIDEIYHLYSDDSLFNDIESNLKKLNSTLKIYIQEKYNPDSLDDRYLGSKIYNYVITLDDFDSLLNISNAYSSGKADSSIRKSKKTLNILKHTNNNDKEFSGKVHKLLDNSKKHNVKLTDHKILAERFSTGRRTKVGFIKLLLNSDILSKLKIHYNNPDFQSIYFVFGFGDFGDSVMSEDELYQIFLKNAYHNEDEMQQAVNLTFLPFNPSSFLELTNLIDKSESNIDKMTNFENHFNHTIYSMVFLWIYFIFFDKI